MKSPEHLWDGITGYDDLLGILHKKFDLSLRPNGDDLQLTVLMDQIVFHIRALR